MTESAEVYADLGLMMVMSLFAFILVRVDPLLPTMWATATMVMTGRPKSR